MQLNGGKKMYNNEELTNIIGGAGMSGAILNALVRAVNSVLEVGRSLGSAIRRISSGVKCGI